MAEEKEYEETKKARQAQKHAKSSAKNFHSAFTTVRKARNAAQGPPTDGEQDLIRAALVFAAGGLDVTVKELIRDSLKKLASFDEDVAAGFEKFTQRQLRSDLALTGSSDPSKFLAQILVSTSPYERLIEKYIYDLTGSSLQSVDELFKAASALDISDAFIKEHQTKLKEAFNVRNSIIHELDINFEAGVGQRQRKSRTKSKLEEYSNLMLKVAEDFIKQTEAKLNKKA